MLELFSRASHEDTMRLDAIAMAAEMSGTQDGAVPGAESAKPQTRDSAAPQQTQDEAPAAQTGTDGYGLYLRRPDGSLEMLQDINDQYIRTVADTLNRYKSKLPEDGKVFYTCVPLTNYSDFILREDRYVGWYENLDQRFSELLVDGAYMVSAPNVLEPHLMDEELFFQADHHWTPLAAYYVIEEMMRIQGVPVVPYDEYNYKVNWFGNSTSGRGNNMDLLYPLQPTRGSQMPGRSEGEDAPLMLYDYEYYVAYLAGGNDIWTKYESGFSTGRDALVIGDSFTTAFVPYLLPYYDSVHRADPRYNNSSVNGGTVSELIEYYGIDDVYIVLSYDNGVDSGISSTTLGYMIDE